MFVKHIPPYFCKIEIVFESGIIPDFDESGLHNNFSWVSSSDINEYNKLINQFDLDCSAINFQAELNQQKIYFGYPTATETVVNQSIMQDQPEIKQYQLIFQSLGFTDQHMPLITPTTSVRAAIKLISLKIENIDVINVFDNQANFFNGTVYSRGGLIFSSNATATLNITVPIYRWLVSNKQLINNQL